ncbi:uncharacterized protein [Apostichopus japonicus]|uniref:uncharacterized protein n=1 Tax=Stichopus japonicus TaxID=307972 RepID=UPI003AB6064A
MVHHLIFPPCDGNHINGKLELFSPEISLLRELPVSCPNYSTWKKCVQLTEQGKCGLISLDMIFGGHMMRILHRMVYNMLMVMLRSQPTTAYNNEHNITEDNLKNLLSCFPSMQRIAN